MYICVYLLRTNLDSEVSAGDVHLVVGHVELVWARYLGGILNL